MSYEDNYDHTARWDAESVREAEARTQQRSARSAAERKKLKKKGQRRRFTLWLAFVLIVSAILAGVGWLLADDMCSFNKDPVETTIEITRDDNLNTIANKLHEDGLVRYKWFFKLFGRVRHAESRIGIGTYAVNSDMDYGQLISALRGSGEQRTVVRVTIPEGYTLQDICDLLVEKKVLTAEKFWETANTYPFSHAMLADVPMVDNRLEGYLFPDTYDFYVGDNAVNVINKMLNNFVKKYTKAMRNLTEANGLTIAEVVKVASLVEKEAKLADERTTIAGVIYNRLHSSSFPYLQIDATIMYATGHKDALTADDLKIDSPYNTYTHEGLPPTAICNPGISCLMAAIQPEKTRYYYYVADTDGSHIFSRTLDEHNRAVAKVAAKSQ